jgi:hypothetical protein
VTRAASAALAFAYVACGGSHTGVPRPDPAPPATPAAAATPDAALAALAGGSAAPDAGAAAADTGLSPAPGYLKGQLHLHSLLSGDGIVPAEDVVAFYQRHGYDFIVFTDHNSITVMADAGDMLVIPGVELTYNTLKCDPPPEKKRCLVHMNALFVTEFPPKLEVPRARSHRRIDLYQRFLDETHTLGGLPMLNHPNFAWTVTPEIAVELGRRGVPLFEFANQGMPRSNPGDARHPSTETMWDLVLTAGVDMWGVASDDAHDYDQAEERRGKGARAVYPGDLGWVMVHAARDPAAIRAALEKGDFYASTGVTLHALAVEDGELVVEAAGAGPFRIEFVGPGGAVLAVHDGPRARFSLAQAAGGYVRARVFGPGRKLAWTQPVRVPAR